MDANAAVQKLRKLPSFLSSTLSAEHLKKEPMSLCDTLSGHLHH